MLLPTRPSALAVGCDLMQLEAPLPPYLVLRPRERDLRVLLAHLAFASYLRVVLARLAYLALLCPACRNTCVFARQVCVCVCVWVCVWVRVCVRVCVKCALQFVFWEQRAGQLKSDWWLACNVLTAHRSFRRSAQLCQVVQAAAGGCRVVQAAAGGPGRSDNTIYSCDRG